MKKDILNKKDIEKLVNLFYEKVKQNERINNYFDNEANVDWDKHLKIMRQFWENVLFYTGTYTGNPMLQHLTLHAKNPFNAKDFAQWIVLFNKTVDELFEGENAKHIKQRAQNISTIMQIKMFK